MGKVTRKGGFVLENCQSDIPGSQIPTNLSTLPGSSGVGGFQAIKTSLADDQIESAPGCFHRGMAFPDRLRPALPGPRVSVSEMSKIEER